MAKQPKPIGAPLQGTHSPGLSILGHLLHGAHEVAALPGNLVHELVSGTPGTTFKGDIGSKPGSGDPPAAATSGQPLSDQVAALGKQLGLPADALSSIQEQLKITNLAKPAGMSDADWKAVQPLLSQALQSKQGKANQQSQQLAYQDFYNQTVLPYLQSNLSRTKQEVNPIFSAMQQNLGNIPAPYRAMFQGALGAQQAGSDEYLTGLGQQAVTQPLLNQLLTATGLDISAQQAAQKAAAQAAGTAGVPGSGVVGAANPFGI